MCTYCDQYCVEDEPYRGDPILLENMCPDKRATLINRIKSRNRNYEKDIDRVYLHRLNIYYKNWFSSIKEFNVLEIDTNNFNIFKDLDQLNKICDDIKNKLNKL